MAVYDAGDPTLQSWVPVPSDSDFPIQNLPFGVFVTGNQDTRPGVRIGDHVLDLAEMGLLEGETLNGLMSQGRPVWRELRNQISWLLNAANPDLRDAGEKRCRVLLPVMGVEMRLPAAIGDYVDFYSSLEHASNVGRMFRDPEKPLLPNWRHLPVGYHGKSGTVSTNDNVLRPWGQTTSDGVSPKWGPTRSLDIELEMGTFIGAGSRLGIPVSVETARDHLFGMVLLNDWSARDIQRWEYQPLGPFLAKSFLTSISPWVVTLDALEPFRVAGREQEPEPLEYLRQAEPRGLDIHLDVWLRAEGMENPVRICKTNFRHMYWSAEQQLAHLTSNGASVRAGDLCGSGTVSESETGTFGSLLELTWNGTKPLDLGEGVARTFLEDGDEVTLHGWCEGNGVRLGFGSLSTKVRAR